MLNEALGVVQAARDMRVVRRGKRVATEHAPAGLALAMAALLEAVEAFDAATAAGVGTPELSPRPDWAVPPGIEDVPGHLDVLPTLDAVPKGGESRGQALEAAEARAELREAAARPDRPRPSEALPGPPSPARVPWTGLRTPGAEGAEGAVEDWRFDFGDESVDDFMTAIDSIDRKLGFAVAKVGWNPKLRALAAAKRLARMGMLIQLEEDREPRVSIPAAAYAELAAAIASVALDQPVPEPVPPAPRPLSPDEREELRQRGRPGNELPPPKPGM